MGDATDPRGDSTSPAEIVTLYPGQGVNDTDLLQFPEMGREIANFRAIFQKMTVDKGGNLVFTLKVPLQYKYQALPLTDHPGMVLRIVASREVIAYSEAIEAELKDIFGDMGGNGSSEDGDDHAG